MVSNLVKRRARGNLRKGSLPASGLHNFTIPFESLLSQIRTLSQDQQVSCFISGLKEVIKADVMATRPLTLTSAIGLARLYEARNLAIKTISQPEVKKQLPSNRPPTHQPPFPMKRLTLAELKERQEKGLCFKCNDKYEPGHRCKKLFMIEACLDGDGDMVMKEEEDED